VPNAVVDASAVTAWLIRDDGAETIDRLAFESDWSAPEVLDLEVANTLRRRVRRGTTTSARAEVAIERLRTAPIERFSHHEMIGTIWSLRDNLTPYDAAYVVLARALRCPLITLDRRLAGAPNLGIIVTIVA
jgi:predicted nucleic acid-binding protein